MFVRRFPSCTCDLKRRQMPFLLAQTHPGTGVTAQGRIRSYTGLGSDPLQPACLQGKAPSHHPFPLPGVWCPVFGIVLTSQGHAFWLPFLTLTPEDRIDLCLLKEEQQRAGVDSPEQEAGPRQGVRRAAEVWAGARLLQDHRRLRSLSLILLEKLAVWVLGRHCLKPDPPCMSG